MIKNLHVVVGGQYGSEAKGHVTARLTKSALQNRTSPQVLVVRVAGPNAGHTAYDINGVAHAFRQIPVGAVVGNVRTLIAAGSEIDIEVLLSEIQRCGRYDIPLRLAVDPNATLIDDEHKAIEQGRFTGEDLTTRLGSTAKGVGAARASRIMREARRLGDDLAAMSLLLSYGVDITPQEDVYEDGWDTVIIEGTQGFGLGVHQPVYPFTTSSDCRSIDFLAMAGLSPWQANRTTTWVVARVYPIRVAGNSGPLANETTWDELGLPPEYTTVTKKMRRVGKEDWTLVARAVRANGGDPGRVHSAAPVRVVITMADQKWDDLADLNQRNRLEDHHWQWIDAIQDQIGGYVAGITTGPNTGVWL